MKHMAFCGGGGGGGGEGGNKKKKLMKFIFLKKILTEIFL
jgi:hypothetical protein